MAAPNKALRNWLKTANAEQARELAAAAKTSVPHLRHIAAGRRKASAELAQRLAHASEGIAPLSLFALDQRALCDACGKCPIAQKPRQFARS